MVSHSASASFSSLSLSRTSDHTPSSSSSSSNASSPSSSSHSSAVHTSGLFTVTTPQTHRSFSDLPYASSAIVPFSWEEKPGVIKKDHVTHDHIAHASVLHSTWCIGEEGDPEIHFLPSSPSGKRIAKTPAQAQPQPPQTYTDEDYPPRLRLPPCLSHAVELGVKRAAGGKDNKPGLQAEVHRHQLHHHRSDVSSAASTVSKLLSSISLQKRRDHRAQPSLEDDPFWLAMVACTNDAENTDDVLHAHRRCSKERAPGELRRSDSARLALRESIHLDQCMPLQTLQNRTLSRKGHSGREHEARYTDGSVRDRASSVGKCSSRRGHQSQTQPRDGGADAMLAWAGLGSKARVGAMRKEARTEVLHGRCKTLSKHHSPPVVDISCSTRSSAKWKHRQQPFDVLGRKSSHDNIVLVSRFP